ncbi:MAG TPA: glycoside hydrolase family 30 beta sandwich domain-containing protein, partial [Vicinamibacterales bacterium]|nr:glycoside hydrolase family 30 beta sandwich domain-containing protein [Vicinamibacterales bacterium]
NGGGGVVDANRAVASTWETFTLYDINGGALVSGDYVNLAASNGQFVSAENGGGGVLDANRTTPLDWETFRISLVSGSGNITSGAQISLQTKTLGDYVSALDGGGSTLAATATAVSGWEAFAIGINGSSTNGGGTPTGGKVAEWETTADGALALSAQAAIPLVSGGGSGSNVITINASTTYQQMTGFGASLTDSSAWLLANQMTAAQRAAAMTALFDPTNGIGVGILRQPMGTSDLAWSFYSYDDVAAGATDPTLAQFSIARDRPYIIPMLQQALATNPALKVMATPWSAPAWMKTNGSLENTGSLIDPGSYDPYAQYFVKFIQQYAAVGIPIWAVTTINEPLIQPVAYPSMSMQWYEQSNLIRYHLGPAFAAAGITTKIFLFDHNWDNESFPQTILGDNAQVGTYTGGIAFHCYSGDPSAMTTMHNAYPDKDIYVTECSGGTWSGSYGDSLKNQFDQLYIGSTRNWAKSIVRWNIALDDAHGPLPTSGGGCTTCTGLITIHSDGSFTKEVDYYAMGHASHFIAAGAYRVDSNSFGSGNVEDVAFVNPDGTRVLLVLNGAASTQTFSVVDSGRTFTSSLPAGAVATFTWK